MKINHSALRTERDQLLSHQLQELENEASRLRVALAGDRTARIIVGLDRLIRRTAYRLIAACSRAVKHAAAAFQGRHADLTGRSTLRRTAATGPAAGRGAGRAP